MGPVSNRKTCQSVNAHSISVCQERSNKDRKQLFTSSKEPYFREQINQKLDQNCDKINCYRLSHSVCGILIWQHKQNYTKTSEFCRSQSKIHCFSIKKYIEANI